MADRADQEPRTLETRTVYQTPWFAVRERVVTGADRRPYYFITPRDYVTVVARTEAGLLLLVRQYRPVIEAFALELPSGGVEPGEEPLTCAKRELWEETGHVADDWRAMGPTTVDHGRVQNTQWTFFADRARVAENPPPPQPGEDTLKASQASVAQVLAWVADGTLNHALHAGVLLQAFARGWLDWPDAASSGM